MQSCNDIKRKYPDSKTGIYTLQVSGKLVKAFCEMDYQSGVGFTFVHPVALAKMTSEDFDSMISERQRALMLLNYKDSTQRYALLSQMDRYQYVTFISLY